MVYPILVKNQDLDEQKEMWELVITLPRHKTSFEEAFSFKRDCPLKFGYCVVGAYPYRWRMIYFAD